MKKQKIAFFLSLAWLVGVVAVFSFPPALDNSHRSASQTSELKAISSPNLVFNLVDQSPEVPAFKASLSLADFVGNAWSADFVPPLTQYLSPSFFAKSKALFDVLTTFFYFFHTW